MNHQMGIPSPGRQAPDHRIRMPARHVNSNNQEPWSDAMTLDTIIFNGFTLGRMLFWLAAVAVLVLLLKIYKFIFGTKKVKLQHTVYYVCSSCGWEGHISKFGTRCPKCDASTGDLSGSL
jgi:hypothetical protein